MTNVGWTLMSTLSVFVVVMVDINVHPTETLNELF